MNKTSYSVHSLVMIFLKYFLAIILVGAIFGVSGFFYASKKSQTVYTASTNLVLVHLTDTEQSYNQLQADALMINTYAQVLTDPVFTNNINKEMKGTTGYHFHKQDLSKQISVDSVPNTAWLKITAKGPTKLVAQRLADKTAQVAVTKLPDYMSGGSTMKQLAPAKQNPVTSSQSISVTKYTIFLSIFGMVLAAVVGFGLHLFLPERKAR